MQPPTAFGDRADGTAPDVSAPGRVESGLGCTVVVCRACCCGNPGKHPGVDHDGQVSRLHELVGRSDRVRTSTCLGHCGNSNIVVVTPPRRSGARSAWFRWVLHDETIDAIADWVRRGGPGRADLPDSLRFHRFVPPKPLRADRR